MLVLIFCKGRAILALFLMKVVPYEAKNTFFLLVCSLFQGHKLHFLPLFNEVRAA